MTELKAYKGILPEIEMIDSYCKSLTWINSKEREKIELTGRNIQDLTDQWNKFIRFFEIEKENDSLTIAINSLLDVFDKESVSPRENKYSIGAFTCDKARAIVAGWYNYKENNPVD